MPRGELLVELRGVSKNYRGLRPLRIQQLQLHAGQSIALMGLDHTAAEVLVDLVTGAVVPDSGEILVAGHPTTAIANSDQWLTWLDQFGLLSERAVLVERFTVEQNLLLPITLALDDVPAATRSQVRALAAEVGVEAGELDHPVGAVDGYLRARIRLARALALDPRILLAEHPNAPLSPDDTVRFAADLSGVISRRQLAALVMTADRTFASAVAEEVLTVVPATGELKRAAGWRRWFS